LSAGHELVVQQSLRRYTEKSFEINYQSYPTGKPQLTVLRITIPPNTALHWHHHPVISLESNAALLTERSLFLPALPVSRD
jgi:hypothetical protein